MLKSLQISAIYTLGKMLYHQAMYTRDHRQSDNCSLKTFFLILFAPEIEQIGFRFWNDKQGSTQRYYEFGLYSF